MEKKRLTEKKPLKSLVKAHSTPSPANPFQLKWVLLRMLSMLRMKLKNHNL